MCGPGTGGCRSVSGGGGTEAAVARRLGARLIVPNPKAQLLSELLAADLLLGGPGIPTGNAIHQARVHIKKARAVLQLLSASVPSRRYRKVKLPLQLANEILRRARDSTVVRETLASIASRALYINPAIQSLEQSWRRHQDPGHAPLSPRDCRRVRVELRRAAKLIDEGFAHQNRDDELRSAVARTYRKAYRAFRHAARTQSRQEWHKCRKMTKCLYYQLAFTDASRSLPGIVQQAHVLESTLGRQRDLALLARYIRRRTVDASAGAPGVLVYLRKAGERLQRRIDRDAVALFSVHPSAFAKRLQGVAARSAGAPRWR